MPPQVLDRPAFRVAMLEKLVWICAYMLVGAAHGGCTVGEVESAHADEVDGLVRELAAAGAAELDVQLRPGTPARLAAYARSVAGYPTAVRELPWRNGWFLGLSRQAVARGDLDPCPRHTAALSALGLAE